MTFMRIALALTVLLGSMAASQAQTVVRCGFYPQMARAITEKYGEARIWVGSTGPHIRIELWSKKYGPRPTRTWTVLRANDRGRACILATGRGSNANPINSEGSL